MINTIVNEKGLTFKDFEIKIFQEACRVDCHAQRLAGEICR